jgi:disulfide bond formation protein DsbB
MNDQSQSSSSLTWLSFAAALVALAGSLWLSIGMNLKACPLCFYQRTFVMSIAAVLAMGLFAGMRPASLLSLLSLPMAAGGLGVSLWHVYLEGIGKLECPAGVLEIGSAPQQALAALAILFVLVLADAVRGRRPESYGWPSLVGGVVVGGVLAFASIRSAPPAPPAPMKPYEQPLEICRPPYRPA